MSEEQNLKKKIDNQNIIIQGLERILKLNEEELSNAEEMVKVYETITEFSRKEMVSIKDSMQAQEATSSLGAGELKQAFAKITDLELANQKLRIEQEKIKKT